MISKWIVLLNYNLGERCADHAARLHALEDVGVFVVDNASGAADYSALKSRVAELGGMVAEQGEETPDAAVAQYVQERGRLVLYRNSVNLGYAGGNNTGLRLLDPLLGGRGQFLIMNPDIVMTNMAASKLLEHPAEICGPAVYEHYMKGICYFLHDLDFATGFSTGRASPSGKITCIPGCCFKISGAALERYGFLPDENFLYDEETKYFERVYHLGGAPVYCPQIQVEHLGSLSVRKHTFNYFYYIFRNRMTYFIDIAGPRYGRYARFAMLYTSWCIEVAYAHLKRRNWDGVRGIFRGVWDGLRRRKGPVSR